MDLPRSVHVIHFHHNMDLILFSREKFEPEPGFELGPPGSNFSLEIRFSKCAKTQIIRFIFTNNLI